MIKILNLPVLVLLISSCAAPRVITKITPEAPEGHIEMGREYISLHNESIDVELGYDGMHGENLVFDFVVINRTSGVLSINPTEFYYVLLNSATQDSSMLPPRMAVHPERIIHHYDETLEAKAGEKKVNTFVGFLDAGFDILINTTAFIATDNPAFIADAVFNTLGKTDQYVKQGKQIDQEVEIIHDEKDIVNQEIFRLTHLPPGKVVSGYVYFPKHPDTEYYMFCFPIEDQMFQFVYNQRKEYRYD